MEKRDPDSIASLTKNMQLFFDDLEGELPANSNFGPKIANFIDCAERFGNACKKHSLQEAAQVLSEMEFTLSNLQKECDLNTTH